MKFSLETLSDVNQIHSYDNDHVVIKQKQTHELLRLESSLIVTPSQVIMDWQISDINGLSVDDIQYLTSLNPEVIILSDGLEFHQLPPKIASEFSRLAIGVEVMSLGAACRTYNLLLAEGRQVVLAINFKEN